MTVYKWTLDQDYLFELGFDTGVQGTRDYKDLLGNVWLTLGSNYGVIYKGYSWDGCSPKFKIGDNIVGIYDGKIIDHDLGIDVDSDQELKYASLVHDALCQFFMFLPISVTREKVDLKFYKDCKAVGFKLSWVYYQAVRLYSKYIRK